MKLILASASPRRKELLEKAGFAPQILVTNADENISENLSPEKFVLEISERKAVSAAKTIGINPNIIIAADTAIAADGKILGKPDDEKHAFNMLKKLENSRHTVYTGITLAYFLEKELKFAQSVTSTEVTFRHIPDIEISEYIKTREPLDKAGAYGIQGIGGKFVESIDGDYDNVVGLPVKKLIEMLNSLGISNVLT